MKLRALIPLVFGLAAVLAVGEHFTKVTAQISTGTIKGHIRLTGKEPGRTVIRMGMDPMCNQATKGKLVTQDTVLVSRDGSLANVFVRLNGTFPATAVPAQPVVLDQRGCIYNPRVVGVRVGQTLQVRNSDAWRHNVHSSSIRGNTFNIDQAKAGEIFSFKAKDEEVMLKLKCDIHSWMVAYVGVVSNPYFSVSNTAGTFQIDKAPTGTYTIEAWHEQYGPIKKTIKVTAGAVTVADFSYTGTEKRGE